MTKLNLKENPFQILTPEDMEADDVRDLFVNPFTDSNKIFWAGTRNVERATRLRKEHDFSLHAS